MSGWLMVDLLLYATRNIDCLDIWGTMILSLLLVSVLFVPSAHLSDFPTGTR